MMTELVKLMLEHGRHWNHSGGGTFFGIDEGIQPVLYAQAVKLYDCEVSGSKVDHVTGISVSFSSEYGGFFRILQK